MEKRFEMESLVIEVTRRCPLKCEHCLRGGAQSLDLDINDVNTLFSKVDYISSLTFTGGEPALFPNKLLDILRLAIANKVNIGSFYIATSTHVKKEVFKQFILACMEWYLYCSDNEATQVNWSNDEFHELDKHNVKLLSVLSFASPKYSEQEKKRNRDYIIAEGRGKDIGSRKLVRDRIMFDEYGGKCYIGESPIYLNCKGNIINGCDFSYKSQDKPENIICNVNDFSIDKVKEYIEKYWNDEGE